MKRTLILGLTAVALTACMGRVPEPVAVQSERDSSLTCVALNAEKAGNDARIRYLQEEQDASEHSNMVIGSFAIVAFLPAGGLMDLSDAETVEMTALNQRNDRLESLRAAKGCLAAPLVPQGYTVYERGQERYQDADGRVVTLPSNTYVYGPSGANAATAWPQQLGRTNGTTQD